MREREKDKKMTSNSSSYLKSVGNIQNFKKKRNIRNGGIEKQVRKLFLVIRRKSYAML